MSSDERHARKQVLLTRIAFQRHELRREITQVKRAAEPGQLLRAVVGDSLGGTIGRALFGGRSALRGDLLAQGLMWLRRYRVAAALIGGVIPALSGGKGWRRALRIGVIAGASWLSWRFLRDQPRSTGRAER